MNELQRLKERIERVERLMLKYYERVLSMEIEMENHKQDIQAHKP